MKAILPALAVGSLFGLTSLGAYAADGTITINGSVTSHTCSIDGNASGAANKTITLDPVSAGALAATGQTAGMSKAADLKFALSGCTGGAKAIATFENGATVDQTSGRLLNMASTGAAPNVQVELLNGAFQPINILTNSNNQVATNGATITGGLATLQYYARYYATGTAGPGAVQSTVQFSMNYL
ncbi:type 1 fimbrial protein [Paraburkholderia sp. Ac-20342]|nr:fimbrial protein [Paraburkholderia sp. Ac-20342]MBN3848527.1 type 1 fimbrial protein [Paraburkholderia sp. Ac-20342]